jgi:hypothetical protein
MSCCVSLDVIVPLVNVLTCFINCAIIKIFPLLSS